MKHLFLTLIVSFSITNISLSSCKDDDNEVPSNEESSLCVAEGKSDTISIAASKTLASVFFDAQASWTAKVEDGNSFASLLIDEGNADSNIRLNVIFDNENESESSRTVKVTITCGTDKLTFTIIQDGTTVKYLTEADIDDFDKYYKPQEFSNINMFRSDAKWSWHRMKQSEHVIVFWETGYGDDPKTSSKPVDIDDMLVKCEQFYKTNVETLKMATVGEGKSYLDKYKLEVYVLWTDSWTCVGSGYDNVIGALWVNHQPCQPIGSAVAHEVGHSFQYQVFCDKILNGEATVAVQSAPTAKESIYGWRYGFGANGDGGCAYWEQCAQWQAFQDYPEEAFTQSYSLFTQNAHRHFHSPWMRYQSYWFQYYFTNKHGIESYGNLWKQSVYPEDALETYMRLYCDNNLSTFWDDYYQYASHAVIYDYGDIHKYYTSAYSTYNTTMINVNGKFRPAYASCPSTSGFNIIALNVPTNGTEVSADLSALPVGSALAPTDAGIQVDGDGKNTGTTTTYNKNEYIDYRTYDETYSSFRLGFVAIKNGVATYGPMVSGATATATMTLADNYDELYLVVVATPTQYFHQYWDELESNDMQWPYEISLTNTNIVGYVDIPEGDPENVDIELSVSCDASLQAYEQGSINLLNKGVMDKISVAFKLQPAEIAAATTAPTYGTTGSPSEGTIVVGLTGTTGTVNYKYTANAGFWCDASGNAAAYGNTAPIYFEYTPNIYSLSYGHKGGLTTSGSTYTIKPTFVYTKNGMQYKATITLKMNY